MSILEKKLVWWRDVPIDVENGLLMYLSKKWKNDIYIISANDYESSRKQCSWDNFHLNNIHMINGNLDSKENQKIINSLLKEDNINVFSGIKGGQRVYLDLLNKNKKNKCVIISEIPSMNCNFIKKICYLAVYSYYYKKYKSIINGLFAMGKDAVHFYSLCGWKNIFNFMYLPNFKPIKSLNNNNNNNQKSVRKIKMLYIGRFDYKSKGVKILMKAVDKIKKSKNEWALDLVGGYGLNKDEIIEWCNKKENINFKGSWNFNCVIEEMSKYDFCIVPSKYDGWNLTPLQSIYSGIGCITTDNSGSQELIFNSGAGIVVSANNVKKMKKAIEDALNNIDLIDNWKLKANKYSNIVSIENVGNYFVNGLKFCYGEISKKHKCPW